MAILETTLKAHNVSKHFLQGGKVQQVLSNVSVTFTCNHSYAITGVSGSGKSTFLHLLGNLDTPSSGFVLFNEKKINSFKYSEKNALLNKELGFVFQFHYLIKELSVLENVILPGLISGNKRSICQKRALHLITVMGIGHKHHAFPTMLSGGEQQRVAIARALFNKPVFLLADEPTANVDADNAKIIIDLLFQAKSEWGMGIILCSHDPVVYERMETKYRLENGELKNMHE